MAYTHISYILMEFQGKLKFYPSQFQLSHNRNNQISTSIMQIISCPLTIINLFICKPFPLNYNFPTPDKQSQLNIAFKKD